MSSKKSSIQTAKASAHAHKSDYDNVDSFTSDDQASKRPCCAAKYLRSQKEQVKSKISDHTLKVDEDSTTSINELIRNARLDKIKRDEKRNSLVRQTMEKVRELSAVGKSEADLKSSQRPSSMMSEKISPDTSVSDAQSQHCRLHHRSQSQQTSVENFSRSIATQAKSRASSKATQKSHYKSDRESSTESLSKSSRKSRKPSREEKVSRKSSRSKFEEHSPETHRTASTESIAGSIKTLKSVKASSRRVESTTTTIRPKTSSQSVQTKKFDYDDDFPQTPSSDIEKTPKNLTPLMARALRKSRTLSQQRIEDEIECERHSKQSGVTGRADSEAESKTSKRKVCSCELKHPELFRKIKSRQKRDMDGLE